MMKNIISLLFMAVTLQLFAQENPEFDRQGFQTAAAQQGAVKTAIKKGDTYYKQGLYDAALEQYMKLYGINGSHAALNYKVGVCHLYGLQPANALTYLERATADVAGDYFCQKGIALLYHRRYDEAREAFKQYSEQLPAKEQLKQTARLNRLLAICAFGETAVKDSARVFIINAGPQVNGYYDDYSAVELLQPKPALYFTSRRPKDDVTDIGSHRVYRERILYAPDGENGEKGDAADARLKSKKHLSVAGVDNANGSLLYYKGKKRFGDIYSTRFKEKNGKTTADKRMKKKISRKTSTEGAISIADNGDAYFISSRMGGIGGKDIWYARKKGKKTFYKPVNLSSLNTPLNEEAVFVSPDGNTLYFSTNGLPGMGGFDVFKSERSQNSGHWGDPVNMGYPVNSPDDDLYYRFAADSTIALLSSKRSGGFGGLDVYYIKQDLRIPFELSGNVTDVKTGKTLAATVKLYDRATDMPVASAANDTLAQRYVITMDDVGNYYLLAEAPGYRSVTDSFVNPLLVNEKITYDFALEKLLHPYTLTGYVSDAKTGKPVMAEVIIRASGKDDVLYRTVTDEKSGYYTITMEDKENVDVVARATDYFDFSERMPLKGIEVEEGSKNIALQRSVNTYTVTGVVTGDGATAPFSANIAASKIGEERITQGTVTGENGRYELMLAETGPFLLEITSEGFFFANSVLEFTGDSTLVVRNFTLKKMESGAKIVIDNILFNTGKATLMPESFASLNRLVNLLKENPKVRIEVSGHTDNTGSAATNRTLSRNRALSVRNYLISQGIAGERVEYNGYGFDRPIAPNNTAEGRAANRRVEIEVLD